MLRSKPLRSRAMSRSCTDVITGRRRIRVGEGTVPPQAAVAHPEGSAAAGGTFHGRGDVAGTCLATQRGASEQGESRRRPAESRLQPQRAARSHVTRESVEGRGKSPVLDLQDCGSYRRARQLLGCRDVTKGDRSKSRQCRSVCRDQGADARSIQSRCLLRLTGYALRSRMSRAVIAATVVISRLVLDREAVARVRSGSSGACVQMAADRFLAHPVRVYKGEQRYGHPQHAQRTR